MTLQNPKNLNDTLLDRLLILVFIVLASVFMSQAAHDLRASAEIMHQECTERLDNLETVNATQDEALKELAARTSLVEKLP